MSKEKKEEKPNKAKPRNVVSITLNKEMREQLEAERREREGQFGKGIKLAPIAREKLAKQLECEKKKGKG